MGASAELACCQNQNSDASVLKLALLLTGKSECTRCEAACGRFCRACLLVRYGLQLEAVREQMAAGHWLCPHCYEEEHPDEVI